MEWSKGGGGGGVAGAGGRHLRKRADPDGDERGAL